MNDFKRFDLMEFVYQIEELKRIEFEYNILVREHEKLKKDYQDLLSGSIKHGQEMMAGWLNYALAQGEKS